MAEKGKDPCHHGDRHPEAHETDSGERCDERKDSDRWLGKCQYNGGTGLWVGELGGTGELQRGDSLQRGSWQACGAGGLRSQGQHHPLSGEPGHGGHPGAVGLRLQSARLRRVVPGKRTRRPGTVHEDRGAYPYVLGQSGGATAHGYLSGEPAAGQGRGCSDLQAEVWSPKS